MQYMQHRTITFYLLDCRHMLPLFGLPLISFRTATNSLYPNHIIWPSLNLIRNCSVIRCEKNNNIYISLYYEYIFFMSSRISKILWINDIRSLMKMKLWEILLLRQDIPNHLMWSKLRDTPIGGRMRLYGGESHGKFEHHWENKDLFVCGNCSRLHLCCRKHIFFFLKLHS